MRPRALDEARVAKRLLAQLHATRTARTAARTPPRRRARAQPAVGDEVQPQPTRSGAERAGSGMLPHLGAGRRSCRGRAAAARRAAPRSACGRRPAPAARACVRPPSRRPRPAPPSPRPWRATHRLHRGKRADQRAGRAADAGDARHPRVAVAQREPAPPASITWSSAPLTQTTPLRSRASAAQRRPPRSLAELSTPRVAAASRRRS